MIIHSERLSGMVRETGPSDCEFLEIVCQQGTCPVAEDKPPVAHTGNQSEPASELNRIGLTPANLWRLIPR